MSQFCKAGISWLLIFIVVLLTVELWAKPLQAAKIPNRNQLSVNHLHIGSRVPRAVQQQLKRVKGMVSYGDGYLSLDASDRIRWASGSRLEYAGKQICHGSSSELDLRLALGNCTRTDDGGIIRLVFLSGFLAAERTPTGKWSYQLGSIYSGP